MGSKSIAITLGALFLPLAASPAMAQGKGVNCMSGEYSAAQRTELAEIGPNMSVADGEIDQAVFDQIGNIAVTAITACVARNGWTEEQILFATLFELGRLNEAAYRASGQLPADQLQLLDDALTTGNRDRLWQVIEASVMVGMGGSDPELSELDALVLGAFLIGAGLDVEDESNMLAEKVGLLLGFMGLQRIGRREFANLR